MTPTIRDKTIDLENAFKDCVDLELKTGRTPTLNQALNKELGKDLPEEHESEWL